MGKSFISIGISLSMFLAACSIYESDKHSSSDPTGTNDAVSEESSNSDSPSASNKDEKSDDSKGKTDSSSSSAKANSSSSSSKANSSSSSAKANSSSSSSKSNSGNGGLIISDECGEEYSDTRDGNTYKTVKIGNQCWFAENLKYADEKAIPNMKGNTFCPGGKSENCENFGRLYHWSTAIDSASIFKNQDVICSNTNQCFADEPFQGLCPDGWRIPTTHDWLSLLSEVKNNFYSLQQTGYDKWENATNNSGFSAVPVGFYTGGTYDGLGEQAIFWTSTQSSTYAQWADFIGFNASEIITANGDKGVYAFAIRCVK